MKNTEAINNQNDIKNGYFPCSSIVLYLHLVFLIITFQH